MSFNYAAERNRFDAEWEKLRKEYAQAGMAEESIEAMYQYDLQQFNADRAYARHNCPLNLSHELIGEDDEFENPFLEKHFEQFTTPYDKLGTHSRYAHWRRKYPHDPNRTLRYGKSANVYRPPAAQYRGCDLSAYSG